MWHRLRTSSEQTALRDSQTSVKLSAKQAQKSCACCSTHLCCWSCRLGTAKAKCKQYTACNYLVSMIGLKLSLSKSASPVRPGGKTRAGEANSVPSLCGEAYSQRPLHQ